MYPGTWARTTPDKAALVIAETGETLTYAELEERSLRLAHVFAGAGLVRGDVVALLSDNTLETYEVYWAVMRSGLYLTAVNHNLAPDEAAYIVDDCGAKALVVSAAKADLVTALEVDVPFRLAYGGTSAQAEALATAGFGSYDDALAAASTQPLADQPHGDDFLYSSGTTGRPKGIKLPLPTYQVDEEGYPYVMIFGLIYGFNTESVYLSPTPVYHAAPLRFMGVVQALGGTVVMMRKFDAEGFLTAVRKYAVTHTQVVPTMFVRMLKLSEATRTSYDTSSLKVVVHAAAPCPVEVKKQMIDWLGPIIFEYYASTEANGATQIDSVEWLAHPGSVGKALLGIPRVCDPEGNELDAGEIGTIYFESESTFSYHGDPEKTASTRHPEHPNWTTVGDLGYVDADGYLFLTDRLAFMVISGGVNIYPQEAEDLFSLHPSVLDIAVLGVPDEEMGERVVAYVEPADGVDRAALPAELTAYARERMAHYKVPVEFIITDDLPRTPTGKLVKGELKKRYAAESIQ